METQLWAIGLVLLGDLIGSFGPILLKKASVRFKLSFKGIFNRYLIGGGLLYIIATAVFIPALRGGDLSVLYPIVSMTYVFVCLWSVKFLKEKMNKFKWLGVLIIIIGVTFIGIGG